MNGGNSRGYGAVAAGTLVFLPPRDLDTRILVEQEYVRCVCRNMSGYSPPFVLHAASEPMPKLDLTAEYPEIAPDDLALLGSVQNVVPILADLCRSDLTMFMPARNGSGALVVGQAEPHSVSPVHSECFVGHVVSDSEEPTVCTADAGYTIASIKDNTLTVHWVAENVPNARPVERRIALEIPYRWVCRLEVHDNDLQRVVGYGTGLMISGSHVLTSARVIYKFSKDRRKYSIRITPGYEFGKSGLLWLGFFEGLGGLLEKIWTYVEGHHRWWLLSVMIL